MKSIETALQETKDLKVQSEESVRESLRMQKEAEKDIAIASERYTYFQNVLDYSDSLAALLDAKVIIFLKPFSFIYYIKDARPSRIG
jgi:hypothetical protein